jgi:hypothetical protein
MRQWILFIDVEGFTNIYQKNKAKAISLLSGLMGDLYFIGTKVYPDEKERLFVYQFSDGFMVSPDFNGEIDRPIAIAIALMRLTLLRSGVLRAAISYGEISDILGRYPEEVIKSSKNGYVSLGCGVMTINPLMGDALINVYNLASAEPKGPLLILDKDHIKRIKNSSFIIYDIDGYTCVNWIESEAGLVNEILKKIGTESPPKETLRRYVERYISSDPDLSEPWKANAANLIKEGN